MNAGSWVAERTAAGGDPASQAAQRRGRNRPVSTVKILIAVTVCAVGSYAVLANGSHVVSDNAVVSAYTISLRAPINGIVSQLSGKVGDIVASGTVLAHIDDPRIDDQRLVGLQSQVRTIAADRAAREQERDSLKHLQTDLLARADRYDRAQAQFMTLQAAEAERQMQSKFAARTFSQRDYNRKSQLGQSGFAAPADVERARSTALQSDADAQANMVRLAYSRLQAQAARDGVLLSNGANDVSASRQRADEIAIRLTDIDHDIDQLTISARETAVQLDAERRRIDTLRSADLVAPTQAMLWRVGATAGERLGVGDTVGELIDCRQAFVVDTIPQDSYPDVVIGSTARIRLAGETADRSGRVVAVTGDTRTDDGRNLAALPPAQTAKTVVAWIALDGAPVAENDDADTDHSRCLVGRTARVILPARNSGGIFRSVSTFFGRSMLAHLLTRGTQSAAVHPDATHQS
jgi:multidrug resistance efflux pump